MLFLYISLSLHFFYSCFSLIKHDRIQTQQSGIWEWILEMFLFLHCLPPSPSFHPLISILELLSCASVPGSQLPPLCLRKDKTVPSALGVQHQLKGFCFAQDPLSASLCSKLPLACPQALQTRVICLLYQAWRHSALEGSSVLSLGYGCKWIRINAQINLLWV